MLIPANPRKRADFERVGQFTYIPPLAGIRPRQDQTRPRNAGGFRKVVHGRYLASVEIGTNLDVTAWRGRQMFRRMVSTRRGAGVDEQERLEIVRAWKGTKGAHPYRSAIHSSSLNSYPFVAVSWFQAPKRAAAWGELPGVSVRDFRRIVVAPVLESKGFPFGKRNDEGIFAGRLLACGRCVVGKKANAPGISLPITAPETTCSEVASGHCARKGSHSPDRSLTVPVNGAAPNSSSNSAVCCCSRGRRNLSS